jgi:microcystin-dependent protein
MDPFVAEVRIFAGNFPPTGWALCNGQILPIAQNTALFSLLGTTYGGDGRSNFALPDLQGSVPIGTGSGPGLSVRYLGDTGGTPAVTLLNSEMPMHSHSVASGATASTGTPSASVILGQGTAPNAYGPAGSSVTQMNANMIAPAGGGQTHNNMQPFVTLTYIIAMQGVFPPRS